MTPTRLAELRAMPYEEYLLTAEWQVTRKRILERDHYQCQGCFAKNVVLNVHHYTYERLGCEEDGDLVTLCVFCHEELHRLLADPPNLPFLHRCGIALGVATLGTIGIEGFLQAPLPAEVGVLIVAYLAAKNSPALYAALKEKVPPRLLAWFGGAPVEGEYTWVQRWILGKHLQAGQPHFPTEEIAAYREMQQQLGQGTSRSQGDSPTDEEITVYREIQRQLGQDRPNTQRPEDGNDLDDLARPKQRGPFLMSEVLRSFTPTLDKIYLATLPNGKHLFCDYKALCHVALAGTTDAGKSNIMRMLVMQLCYAGAKVLILNPHWTGYVLDKQEDWTPIIPYLYDDPMECRKCEKIDYYLNYLANTTVPHRLDLYAHSKPTGKPIFIVIDELPAIVKWSKKHNKDIPGCLDTILKEGRKLGIYLISAAQDFLVDTIGGTGAVRDCYRTAYSVGGDDTTTNKLLGKTKADRPLGKGVVLLRNASNDLCKEAITALVPYVDNASLRLLGPSTYEPSTDTEELEDFGLEDTRARMAGDMRRAPGSMLHPEVVPNAQRATRNVEFEATQNGSKNAEFGPYDATRNARNVGSKPASEEAVSPQNEDGTPVTLPPGWTEEKVALIPGFYRVFNNLDKCLEAVELSTHPRNRDFARDILKQQGLWKEK